MYSLQWLKLEIKIFSNRKIFDRCRYRFFLLRIKKYEELLKVENIENWWNKDMNIKQLCKYFNRKDVTVRKVIKKMCNSGFKEYKYLELLEK